MSGRELGMGELKSRHCYGMWVFQATHYTSTPRLVCPKRKYCPYSHMSALLNANSALPNLLRGRIKDIEDLPKGHDGQSWAVEKPGASRSPTQCTGPKTLGHLCWLPGTSARSWDLNQEPHGSTQTIFIARPEKNTSRKGSRLGIH